VISRELARRLTEAGLEWSPAEGDRFWLPQRSLDDVVFTVSDMVVEVRDLPTGRVLAFNGTTEWALDSIETGAAVWLPGLEHLLDRLGPHLDCLTARSSGHIVRLQDGSEHVDLTAVDAAARALLSVLRG
jgi:hypothetical protein